MTADANLITRAINEEHNNTKLFSAKINEIMKRSKVRSIGLLLHDPGLYITFLIPSYSFGYLMVLFVHLKHTYEPVYCCIFGYLINCTITLEIVQTLLFISYKFVKGFLAITFLLLVFSN